MASGFRSTTGVLLIPLHQEFGWSHETIGLAVSLNLLCFGLGAPFAAALIERAGVRRVVGTALAVIAVSALLTIRMTETWQLFLLWGLVNGLATGAVSVPLAAIIANRWFIARRGLVTGLMTASYASGQLIFLPALAWLAGFDWRWAALAIAAVALLLVLPVVLRFMRDRPEDIGLAPFGADESWTPPPATAAPAFGAALDALSMAMRSQTFWLLAGTFFVCGATTNGLVSTHLIPAAHDHGIAQVTAAGLLALIGVFDVVGTTASGWLTDRYDPRRLPARVLRLAGPVTARASARLRLGPCGDVRLRRRLRARLGGDGAADLRPGDSPFRAAGRRGLRLDLRGAPARRCDGGVGCRADPHAHRRVHRRIPGSGGAGARRSGRRPSDPVVPHGATRACAGDVNDERRRRRRPSFLPQQLTAATQQDSVQQARPLSARAPRRCPGGLGL
jgi:MFS family permease